MGMSYLRSLNTQLFKNIAYVGSFCHILFNLIFNVNSNLTESSVNCSDIRLAYKVGLERNKVENENEKKTLDFADDEQSGVKSMIMLIVMAMMMGRIKVVKF